MKGFAALLFALLLGVAVAFIRPAQPFQVRDTTKPSFISTTSDNDDLLDNPAVVPDDQITPARKCGFCMGVSFLGVTKTIKVIGFDSYSNCM